MAAFPRLKIMKENFLNVFQTYKSYALISAYKNGMTEDEIQEARSGLKWSIRHLKFYVTRFFLKWSRTDDKTNDTENVKEFCSMVFDIPLKTAMLLGKEYNQLSIIFKTGSECREICTIPYTDFDGKRYREGDVVRTFDVKTPDMAREIFTRRVGCPGGKSNGDGNSYTLSGVYKVEDPKPTVFSREERLFPIL